MALLGRIAAWRRLKGQPFFASSLAVGLTERYNSFQVLRMIRRRCQYQ